MARARWRSAWACGCGLPARLSAAGGEVSDAGGKPVVSNDGLAVEFDGRTGAPARLSVAGRELAAAEAEAPAFDVRLDGRWPARGARSALSLTGRGTERAKLQGIAFLTPGVVCRGDGMYGLPRRDPPHHVQFSALTPGRSAGSGTGFAPLVVQLDARLSALWVSDGRVDRRERHLDHAH